MKKLVSIRGKNGELRNGLLKWIDVPNNQVGEFWFFYGLSPKGMWCKLDYWKIVS
jgi:hypothetical protein